MTKRSRLTYTLAVIAAAILSFPIFELRIGGARKNGTRGPTLSPVYQTARSDWTVIAYGDTRFTDPDNVVAGSAKARRWLVQKIAAENPDVILLSGDLPYRGSDANDYVVFREETKPWRDRQIHFYPALGNHELIGGEQLGLVNWWKAFPELNGRRWYSVAYGNAYFIALNTMAPLVDGSEQRAWFDQQIANLPTAIQFVFVVQHHPPFADLPMDAEHTPRANEIDFARHLEQQAASLPVRFIVICGHIHNYERFREHGIDFLVSGGGGAHPHPVSRGPEDLYQDSGFPNYHYVKFTFDGTILRASMIRLGDGEGDSPSWESKDSFNVLPANLPTVAHTTTPQSKH
ncbi:MAG TPA: metallophosphoesterase [Terriglobales bacterium]|nr:metallophosphoesterase [Terriglobales bacterium]